MNSEDKMQEWRDGLISNGEMLGFLLVWMIEVRSRIHQRETEEAESRPIKTASLLPSVDYITEA